MRANAARYNRWEKSRVTPNLTCSHVLLTKKKKNNFERSRKEKETLNAQSTHVFDPSKIQIQNLNTH